MASLVLTSAPGVGAQTADAPASAEQGRSEQQRRQFELAAGLDVTAATNDQLMSALFTVENHLQTERARVAELQRAAADADRRTAQARAEHAENGKTIDRLTAELREQALHRYMSADKGDTSVRLIATGDFDEAGQRKALGAIAHGDSTVTLEQLRTAKVRADELDGIAAAATAEGDARRHDASAKMGEIDRDAQAYTRIKNEWDARAAVMKKAHDELQAFEAAQARAAAPAPVNAPPALAPTRKAPAANPGGGMIWPMEGKISRGWLGHHTGIDIWSSANTPIYAALGGTVTTAGMGNDGYGIKVIVDHGGGRSTLYAHQSRLTVSVGQTVGQGDQLGFQGSTGRSTGPHLHFEVLINGRPVNPAPYLPAR